MIPSRTNVFRASLIPGRTTIKRLALQTSILFPIVFRRLSSLRDGPGSKMSNKKRSKSTAKSDPDDLISHTRIGRIEKRKSL